MAKQQTRTKREPDDEVAKHEKELAEYLQERIKPGLNRGAIPLLARSIAKELVDREHRNSESEDAESDEQPEAEADEDAESDEDEDVEADADAEADDDYEEEAEADDDEADDDYEDEAEAEADEDADEDEDESDADDAEAQEETSDEGGGPVDAFEAEMHELQSELGDDWILRFSVEGDNAWLTAEKKDGSQHVEAPTAEVLLEAVELLEDGGDRSS